MKKLGRKDKQEAPPRQVEMVPRAKLIPYARNAKLHSEAQVKQIAASIREFGFCNPVLIDKGSGIIAGHGRVLAAELLEIDEIPCIRLAHLSETQKRAYILADNRLAETGGGWDDKMLREELKTLDNIDLSIVGFEDILEEPAPVVKEVEVRPPPHLAWVLIGVPQGEWKHVAPMAEKAAKINGAIVETTTSD